MRAGKAGHLHQSIDNNGARMHYSSVGQKNTQGQNALTRDNLLKLDGSRTDLMKLLDEENATLNSKQSFDVRGLLHNLNLPPNLFQKMEEMPQELWPYILDEIIYEAQIQKYSTIQKSIMENQQQNQDKLLSAIQSIRKQVTRDNILTIKQRQQNHANEKLRSIEQDKKMNELYPKNMRDPSKSTIFERNNEKQKQKEQYQMLKEQQQSVLHPANPEITLLQKQIEDQYFTDQALRARKDEINQIIMQREEKLSKAMQIKSDWDMSVNLNKLIKEVETNPRAFYDQIDQKNSQLNLKNSAENLQISKYDKAHKDRLASIDQEHMTLEKKLSMNQYRTIENFENLFMKVNKDIDKKSTYSRKLENQFLKQQIKQANKNKKLLQADKTHDKPNKMQKNSQEPPFDCVVKYKQLNPQLSLNKGQQRNKNSKDDIFEAVQFRKKDKNKTILDFMSEKDQQAEQGQYQLSDAQNPQSRNTMPKQIKPTEHKILSNEETTVDSIDKRGSNNVFFRLNEAAKRKVKDSGASPINNSSSEYDCTLHQWIRKNNQQSSNKTAAVSHLISRKQSRTRIDNMNRTSSFLDIEKSKYKNGLNFNNQAPGTANYEKILIKKKSQNGILDQVTKGSPNAKSDLGGYRVLDSTQTGRSKRLIKSLLQTRQTNISDMNRKLEGWVSSSKDNAHLLIQQNDLKKVSNLINSAQLTQRSSVIENRDDNKNKKLNRDMFYDDEAMFKMNLGNFEDIYAPQTQFDQWKSKNAVPDKKRPQLMDIIDNVNSGDKSLDSSLIQLAPRVSNNQQHASLPSYNINIKKPQKYKFFKESANESQKPNTINQNSPLVDENQPTNIKQSNLMTLEPNKKQSQLIKQHFPWENRAESLKQINKIIRE